MLPKHSNSVLREYALASRRKAGAGDLSAPAAGTPGGSERAEDISSANSASALKERPAGAADAFGRTSGLAISMSLCVFLCGLVGGALDRRLNTSPVLLIIGLLTGAVAAFKILYDIAKKY